MTKKENCALVPKLKDTIKRLRKSDKRIGNKEVITASKYNPFKTFIKYKSGGIKEENV